MEQILKDLMNTVSDGIRDTAMNIASMENAITKGEKYKPQAIFFKTCAENRLAEIESAHNHIALLLSEHPTAQNDTREYLLHNTWMARHLDTLLVMKYKLMNM